MQRDDGLAPVNKEAQPRPGQVRRRATASPRVTAGRGAGTRGRRMATNQPDVAKTPGAALPRLLERYRQEVSPALVQEFGYRSIMQAPRLRRIVLNMGLGEALTNARALETASEQLATITGQKPVITRAHRSVAAFKVREGMAVGAMVTMRGRRMWEFLDRFLSTALPRIRDFRGVPRSSFDGQGNYSVGIREQLIFPEINFNRLDRIRGLQVNIVTTARSDQEGVRLLELLGMPFARGG